MRRFLISGWLRCALVLSMVVLSIGLATALDPSKQVKQYVSKPFTVADGLPQPWIQAITQTADGYMWFGTQEGLARFNGTQFTTFDKSSTPEINHNNIRVLLNNPKDGALWIGTFGGGLTRYLAGKFRTFTVADGLPGDFILSLAWGRSGELWIGTDKGLAIYQNGRITPFKWADDKGRHPISALISSPDGRIWFIVQSTIYQIDGQQNVSRIAADIPEPQAILADNHGALWIGTMARGVYKWTNGKITSYSESSGLPKAPIRVVYQDKAGRMWVSAYNTALCRLQPDEKFDCYTAKDGLMEPNIVSFYEDREGNLWVGTEANGLLLLRDTNFVTYDKREGLSDNYVLGIYEAKDGAIWVGGRQGLNKIRDGHITSIRVSRSVAGNSVEVIEDAGHGDLWLGTDNGLKLLRGNKVIRTFTTRDGLATNGIHALLMAHEGSLWIGNRDGGLTRYKNGKFTRFSQQDGLSSVRVRNMFEDHEGSLWFSTEEGLSYYKNNQFTNIALEKGKGGATGGAICIHEDREHVLWIGTYGSGLVRLKAGEIVSFKTKDGLFDDSIWSIVEDDFGNLWMSSNRGLFRVRKADFNDFADGKIDKISSIAYSTADGLLTTDFNGGEQTTGWKTRTGKLLFATSIGLVEVDATHFRTNALPPPVVIEATMVDKKSITDQQSVPIGRGELEFHFAGLSYVAPQKVVMKYKLEGFDKDWTFAGNRRVAYYTNLPPGQYQFKVLAANNDGVWNTTGASLDLYLKPHFYQTTWFGMLCAFSVLLIAVGAYRFRIRQLRNRQEELVELVDNRTRSLQEEIVQRKAAEQQLQEQVVERNRATEEAEAAARAKGEFLANMSHEIRTPLNGVIGSLDLASQTPLTGEQKELLSMCRSSADSLLAVLNDILDFSKIEAGKLRFEQAEFQLAEIVGEAVRVMAVSAHQKKLELAWFVDPEIPRCLRGDRTRLKQVLLNLLGNAVKFTQQGEVLVRVQAEERKDDEIELKFSVSDTGIGIPAEKQASIFEAFSQADTSVTRQFGGTGLGLAICARIVDLLGGRIWVESTPGRGSTFYFAIALKLGQPVAAMADGVIASLQGRRVMVVDDSQTNCRILETILRGWGIAVTAFTSAAEALVQLRLSGSTGQPFEVLICDSNMPEMNGFALLQQLKAGMGFKLKTIMMLTSDDYAAAARRCRQLEVDSCLIKPVGQSELRFALMELLSPAEEIRAQEIVPSEEQPEACGKLRILLAEDNLVNQKLAVKMLEKSGHEVTVMENGRLAVQHLQENNDYDVVFMDVHMPEMDGYAATEAIRELETKRGAGGHIPIIAMTANAMAGDRDKCLEKGMDGYIAKPISLKELARVLQQVASGMFHGSAEEQAWMHASGPALPVGNGEMHV